MSGFRVGIDVGGTFTDLALQSRDGRLHVFKVPTRPSDIGGACLDGLASLLEEAGVSSEQIDYWSHGSTVATNALVQRRGARLALLVTEGFRDILEIRRQIKPDRYNLHKLKPQPFVTRDLRLEVGERMLWDGTVYRALNEADLQPVMDRLETLGVESVAICFIHAYANPAHEKAVLEEVRRRLPDAYVCASHQVLPEFREYPRTSTTVANAYVGPLMERYLEGFAEGGRNAGIHPPLTIFQSNGGITSAAGAASLPVKVLYSGPAAGVQGAVHVAGEVGCPNVITFDMGGTSCDVCLIQNGEPLLTDEKEIAGFPVRTPMIDVHSVGAGGGSIAWVDKGGLLQVGPQSAGADPGPAAYGRGGKDATVTDANMVLGRLNPRSLLSGRLLVHPDRSRDVVGALAVRLNLSREATALGIIDVVNSNMMGAIRVVSVERGYDYRECVLLAFGGAGPLHAADVAREMGIRRVLVPLAPGILCAMGLLMADYRSDFTCTRMMLARGERWRDISQVFAGLEDRAREWTVEHQIPMESAVLVQSLYMRYLGQSHQLRVAAPQMRCSADVDSLMGSFHAAHEQAYGYARREAEAETVDFQLSLTVPVVRPQMGSVWQGGSSFSLSEARLGDRLVWYKGTSRPVVTPLYQRDRLPCGCDLRGPAILEQLDATTVVPPDAEAAVDSAGNIHITLG